MRFLAIPAAAMLKKKGLGFLASSCLQVTISRAQGLLQHFLIRGGRILFGSELEQAAKFKFMWTISPVHDRGRGIRRLDCIYALGYNGSGSL